MDIDILIENTPENLENIKTALEQFISRKEIEELNSEMTSKYQVVRVGLGNFHVDLMTKIGDVDYKSAEKEIIVIDDVNVPVAGVETMIKLKMGMREIDKKDRLFLEWKKKHQTRD